MGARLLQSKGETSVSVRVHSSGIADHLHEARDILTSAPRRRKRHKNVLIATHALLEALIIQHNHLARRLRLGLGLDARLLLDEVLQAL